MFESAGQFKTVDAGNVEIGYHDVGHAFERPFKRLQTVMSLFDAKAGLGQPLGIHLPVGTVIFDDQDAWSEPQRQPPGSVYRQQIYSCQREAGRPH